MDNNPTVKIIVDFAGIFQNIDQKVVYCKNYFALVGDKFISYDTEHDPKKMITITEPAKPSLPPTITLKGDSSIFDFKVFDLATGNEATNTFLDWFHDSALKPVKFGVNSNVTSYQQISSGTLDVTMMLVEQNPTDKQEYTIGWDPIVVVDDVNPQ
mgnify:CR=1 FL=1